MSTIPADPVLTSPDRRSRRIAVASGSIGTAVEYYDFFVYGTAAALVLNRLFFPNVSPVLGTLAAFATFAVGFVVRPIGSIVLGHVGDRIGRKRALVFSLLLMGVATFIIGLLPTYGQVGVLAPILLVTMRLVQGLALGGEWGGATVLAAEYADPKRRGLMGALVQIGSPLGLLLSSGVFALVTLAPDDFVDTWGWRIPFLLSAVLVAIGLIIRSKIIESPEFKRAIAAGEVAKKAPVLEVFQYSWRSVLVAIGIRFAPDIGFYLTGTFLVGYAVSNEGYTSGEILVGVSVAAAIEVCTIPLFGMLSDRVGRRRVYVFGCIWWFVLAFPLFALVGTGNAVLTGFGIVLALAVGHSMLWGIGAAINSELFPTRYRTTGAALGLNVANIVGGGPAALIASALVIAAGGTSVLVSLYLMLAAVISLVAILVAPETSRRDLALDYSTASDATAARRDVAETGHSGRP